MATMWRLKDWGRANQNKAIRIFWRNDENMNRNKDRSDEKDDSRGISRKHS